ncbi:MAG TPA: hypothetical protein PK971_01370 [Saprospiraceae bacterium]|nr:hypothetical protein [Saprospiraceae bacterium]HND86943.1 hypothetical protein [Saprospiraceae bacterium]
MRLFLLIISLGISLTASAQMKRTMYQVFEMDSVKRITLDLAGLYELHSWAGNSVMIENNIEISHASPEILDFLIKEGRYDVVADTVSETERRIYTKIRDRKPIKTPAGECTEIATVKIFVPDTYLWSDDRTMLTRKEY